MDRMWPIEVKAVERRGRYPRVSLRDGSLAHVFNSSFAASDNQFTAPQRVISRNGQVGRGRRSCVLTRKKEEPLVFTSPVLMVTNFFAINSDLFYFDCSERRVVAGP